MSETEAKVHLCFDCGQKNRIPVGKEAGAKCGGCGTIMYASAEKKGSSSGASSPSGSHRPAPAPPKGKSGGVILVVVTCLLAIGVGAFWLSNESGSGGYEPSAYSPSSLNYAPSQGVAEPERPAFLEPTLPIQSKILKNTRPFYDAAPFEVETPPGGGYYLKLVDANSGDVVVTILVKGGEKYEAEVPLGSYRLRYATGQNWYGEEHLFGPDETSYYVASDIFEFSIEGNYYVGNTLVLKKMLNGNLDTHKIPAENF